MPSFWRRQSVRVGLVAFGLMLLFVGKVLSSHAWNPMAFVFEGTSISQGDPNGTVGYDGQFVYYIARDPLHAAPFLTPPAHRYRRIVYPVLAWALSGGGNLELLPWVMPLINVVAVAVAAGALAELLARYGANPWYALTLLAYIGTLFAARANLNEPLAIALALAGWLLCEQKRLWPALLLFALAGLAKELGLVIPLGLAAWDLIAKKWRRAALLAVVSSAPYLLWSFFLNQTFGAATHLITPVFIPFAGFVYLDDPASRVVVVAWVLLPVIAGSLAAALDLRRQELWAGRGQLIFLVAAQAALIATMPRFTWPDPLAIFRTAMGTVAVLLVWLAAYHRRWLPYAAGGWAVSGLLLALVPGML